MNKIFRTAIKKPFRIVRQKFSDFFWKNSPPQIWMLLKNKPVLVFQHGKVGSVAIHKGLIKIGINALHTHNCTENLKLKHIRKAIEAGVRGWKVITLCRDPVGAKISGFFQNLDHVGHGGYVASQEQIKKMKWQELANIFIQRFSDKNFTVFSWPIGWFYRQLQGTFNINIFEYPFDKGSGHSTYRTKQAEILLIRYENLKDEGVDAIKNFLNRPDYALISDNVSDNKYYADHYRAFKKNIVLPKDILMKVYMSKEVRHFYTDLELKEFAEKWRIS